MIRIEYSVLKEKMKENECGWSYHTSSCSLHVCKGGA
jgi:hypothetical protein